MSLYRTEIADPAGDASTAFGLGSSVSSDDSVTSTPPELPQMRARPGKWQRARSYAYEDLAALHPRLRLLNALLSFLPSLCFNRLRTALYRLFGVSMGKGAIVMGRIELEGPGPVWKRLHVGERTLINAPFSADLNAEITIGNDVGIGHHVVFVTADHDFSRSARRCGTCIPKPIVVEDGCWIAAGATVLPGVTLGRGCVVAAGAVVARDVPPNTLVGGVPARVIRKLSE